MAGCGCGQPTNCSNTKCSVPPPSQAICGTIALNLLNEALNNQGTLASGSELFFETHVIVYKVTFGVGQYKIERSVRGEAFFTIGTLMTFEDAKNALNQYGPFI